MSNLINQALPLLAWGFESILLVDLQSSCTSLIYLFIFSLMVAAAPAYPCNVYAGIVTLLLICETCHVTVVSCVVYTTHRNADTKALPESQVLRLRYNLGLIGHFR